MRLDQTSLASLIRSRTCGTYDSPTLPKIEPFSILADQKSEDLAFTLFLPSEKAIERDLRLNQNDSNSYAILTRILGFSAVPRWISSGDLEDGKQKVYDSISGLSLYIWKDANEMVVVNGVVSEEVDLRVGKLLVHVMDGVVMDTEFEQSLHDDDDDDGEEFN